MRQVQRFLAVCAAALVVSGVPSAAPKLGQDDVVALDHWVQAVERHRPGNVDDALAEVAALTYDGRMHVNDALPLFLDALADKVSDASDATEERIVQIGLATSRAHGSNAFLRRAAMLHADAVFLAARLPAPPVDPRDAAADDSQLVSANDGEYQGVTQPVWHLRFAEDLLDRVEPRPSSDPFVAQWYDAMITFLMARTRYGEAAAPLRRAGALLPNDPAILFDQACLWEALGLPRAQEVLADPRAQHADSRAQRPVDSDAPVSRFGAGARGRQDVRAPVTERVANDEAEGLFRRVIAIDASRAEARVRLGRLLVLRKRYVEADAMLAAALATTHDPVVSYLAHLFACRADAGLGRLAAAAAHADAALVLFPDAQSALIAQSQIALQRADVASAVDPIRRLTIADGRKRPRDPWSQYHTGPGRNADALMAGLRASVAP